MATFSNKIPSSANVKDFQTKKSFEDLEQKLKQLDERLKKLETS